MKKKNIFIAIILILLAVFSVERFNRYPKKVVATILYTIDDRILDFTDDYFAGLGLKDIYFKIKDTGDYTFSVEMKKNHRPMVSVYNIENASNKSRLFYSKINENEEIKTKGEKIINNEVYLYRPEITEAPLYIDKNNIKALSDNSTALKDLGINPLDENLFSYPITILEKNNNLKKYIKREWNKILRSTAVSEISENKYEIRVNTEDLEDLVEKIYEFYLREDDNLYSYLSNKLVRDKDNILENLRFTKNIVFYLETDEEKDIFKLYSKDEKYNIEIGNEFTLKIPGRYIFIEPEENNNYNTVKGRIDNRIFRMSYYPDSKKLIYRDKYSNIKLFVLENEKSRSLKVISSLDGMKYSEIDFNLDTNAKKITKEKNYIELLKLDQENWAKLKSGDISEGSF